MSTVADLPLSAKRLFRPEPTIEAEGLLSRQIDRAEITWSVPTGDTTAFFNAVAGSAEIVGGTIGGLITRVIPLQHPEYGWMLADSFRGTRRGWDGTLGYYSHTFVTVHFRTPTWDLDGAAAFITVRSGPTERWMQCSSAIAVFTDGTTHPARDPGILVNGTDLSLTVHQLPYLPLGTYAPFQNCTNADEFWGYPAKSVIYHGPGLVRNTSMAGVTTYEVEQRFSYSAVPWNQEFKDDGTLDDLFVAGNLRYPTADFTQLFR